MESLTIAPTEFTPQVQFDISNHIFEISGVSMPENASGFYTQLLSWLKDFKENIIVNSKGSELMSIQLNFKLSYCNSASSKFLLTMMEKLRELMELGFNIEINWYYDAGDDMMLDDGKDLSDSIKIPFNYHAIIK
jgi:hypothetical protein